MSKASIGVIGGSGLYQIEGMTSTQEVDINTPFGKPSDAIVLGHLGGVGVAFLPRHGRGHRLLPSEVPSRANIYALKSLGVVSVIAINSAGSFRENIAPGTLVIPDQIIDFTKGRPSTFFGEGMVGHVPFAEPFCPELSRVLFTAAREAGALVQLGGTFLAMEGPAFSTKAESNLYRSWGADIIGMTVIPEAKLAREAEICYASVACVTDYDCWLERAASVTVEMILDCMRRNTDMAKKIVRLAVGKISGLGQCQCNNALRSALVTAPAAMPAEQKEKLRLIVGKYVQ